MLAVPAVSAAPLQAPSTVDQVTTGASETQVSEAEQDVQGQTNYTRLYVDDDYRHIQLKPGESDSFTVSVRNDDDSEVTVDPHLYLPPTGDLPVKESWVSIDEGELTLNSDEQREITVDITIPEDANLGDYRGKIVMTNETITYPGAPPRPVHAATFTASVYKEPTIEITDRSYRSTQIQAGGAQTYSFTIENTGEQAVPVDPTMANERHTRYPSGENSELKRSWLTIDAPTEIPPGEIAHVNVTVEPPTDASVGRYNAELDLGLKDPARDDRNDYWQRVNLHFQVWDQPEEPFTTDFSVSREANNVTLTVNTDGLRQANAQPPNFDVEFEAPDGTTIEANRVQKSTTGRVDLAENSETMPARTYGPHNNRMTFTYQLDNPDAGEWEVNIMPESTTQFSYEIVRNEG